MDFEVFLDSLFKLINESDNAYFALYAAATCVLTQIFKKIFVNKVKVDVLHKFDFATVLPFIFGAVFAVVDAFAVKGVRYFNLQIALDLVVNCATVGALATAIFKLISSVSGKSLSKLMSDDVFGIFYTQLLYYGNVRQKLLDKSLSLKDFIAEVKLISSNASDIYLDSDDEDVKRGRLVKLLGGIVDDDNITACVNVLNKAMIAYTNQRGGKEKSADK
ncbi:MAG: hypothetical protein NC099_05220 [Corallococcus sp.]|nr:hypothetical protein [Corallococcus sp.]